MHVVATFYTQHNCTCNTHKYSLKPTPTESEGNIYIIFLHLCQPHHVIRCLVHPARQYLRIQSTRPDGTSNFSSENVGWIQAIVNMHNANGEPFKNIHAHLVHQNYVGIDNEKNPYFLSIVAQDSVNQCVPMYRAILFRKHVSDLIGNHLFF